MTVRILVADKLERGLLDELEGVSVDHQPKLTAEELPSHLEGIKVLVVRSTKVTAEALAAAKDLALVVRAGSGVNTIDVAAASARGIYVANCPGRNAVAVAELTWGLILGLDRSIAAGDRALKAGEWNKAGFSQAPGLKGRTLGLVGFGAIAKQVSQRARGFDMPVVAYARSLTEAEAEAHGARRLASLEDVFEQADVVSLHLPATEETRGLIDLPLLQRMKPGAYLINTARHEVVNADAVLSEVNADRIRYATDVFADEPQAKTGAFQDPVGQHPRVLGSHHIGASTHQAQAEVAHAAGEIVQTFVQTGDVPSAVNLLSQPPVRGTLVVRHADRVGVLANVLDLLRRADINVETMENLVFAGGKAACARINVADRPAESVIEDIASSEHIIAVELI